MERQFLTFGLLCVTLALVWAFYVPLIGDSPSYEKDLFLSCTYQRLCAQLGSVCYRRECTRGL
jgi:hypothetical protein